MKIELYLVPKDKDGELLENFLKRNKLLFRMIIVQSSDIRKSFLKITYSHSITRIEGFNPISLKHLLEHIKKYKPKLK